MEKKYNKSTIEMYNDNMNHHHQGSIVFLKKKIQWGRLEINFTQVYVEEFDGERCWAVLTLLRRVKDVSKCTHIHKYNKEPLVNYYY